ncbi:MAG: amidohydrolase [Bacteroidetes bacterium]|nr:amidohydrolase [Bacteroidota bacterium]
MIRLFILFSFILCTLGSCAQSSNTMDFETYDPVSTLVVPEHKLTKAKFPFIDVHNHQWDGPAQDIKKLVGQMDNLNMKVMINLSGRGYKESPGRNGEFDIADHNYLVRYMKSVAMADARRVKFFTNISFINFGNKGWIEKTLQDLEEDVQAGACGLKIYKDLGMSFKDENNKFIAIDDPRLDPVWDKCGELKIPVLIHTADPESFWEPEDKYNERWLEIKTHPDRKRSNTDPAPWATLIEEQHHMFMKHPNTIFIAAHFGWYANNLTKLDSLLTQMPNVIVEFGAVIAEIGRQPKAARKFFEKYQDRILFGKDSWVPEEYTTYFRVLETDDEYFPYHKKYHAFWRMYGMGLSDDILKKIYYKNALRIIPGIDKSQFPE